MNNWYEETSVHYLYPKQKPLNNIFNINFNIFKYLSWSHNSYIYYDTTGDPSILCMLTSMIAMFTYKIFLLKKVCLRPGIFMFPLVSELCIRLSMRSCCFLISASYAKPQVHYPSHVFLILFGLKSRSVLLPWHVLITVK